MGFKVTENTEILQSKQIKNISFLIYHQSYYKRDLCKHLRDHRGIGEVYRRRA